jgi:hypothetical protein
MSTWRYTNPDHTQASDGEGTFVSDPGALQRMLAGDGASGVAPIEILAFQRWANIEAARVDLLAEVEARAAAMRLFVIGTTDASKIAVYREKYDVALAALAGDEAALATLAPEASARGQTPAQLAALVKALGDAWRGAGLAIDAASGAHKVAIGALTLETAADYDLGAYWPG